MQLRRACASASSPRGTPRAKARRRGTGIFGCLASSEQNAIEVRKPIRLNIGKNGSWKKGSASAANIGFTARVSPDGPAPRRRETAPLIVLHQQQPDLIAHLRPKGAQRLRHRIAAFILRQQPQQIGQRFPFALLTQLTRRLHLLIGIRRREAGPEPVPAALPCSSAPSSFLRNEGNPGAHSL